MRKGEGDTRDIEGTEDVLVVLGQPDRQKDIEVVAPLIRVATGNGGEWTAPAVDRQHDDLHRDDGCEPCGSPMRTAQRGKRDRDDARDEECPHDGVRHLDRRENRGLLRRGWMICHEAASRVGCRRHLRRIASVDDIDPI